MNLLLYIAIATAALSIIIDGCILFIIYKHGIFFKKIENYLAGLVEIEATLKDMAQEHHTTIEELINLNTETIIQHIGFINRWQKAIAKLIRIGAGTPMETVEEATNLHDMGLSIAKVAFEDKKKLEDDVSKKDTENKDEESGN